MGRAVYIVNGETAQVLNWFGVVGPGTVTGSMSFSIPSDVTALNTDCDTTGFIDRLYVGDMGGNVWRFDIDDATPANWIGKKLADLSGGDVPKRKIFFPPAAVKQDVPERFDAVYVGTGDREHPLLIPPATAADKIFMIMDRDVGLAMGGSPAAVFPTDFLAIADDLRYRSRDGRPEYHARLVPRPSKPARKWSVRPRCSSRSCALALMPRWR